MNYSIIATRTHNLYLMDSAFKTLLQCFPESASGIFKQGMSKMVRLNYPQHVRVIMEIYNVQYLDALSEYFIYKRNSAYNIENYSYTIYKCQNKK